MLDVLRLEVHVAIPVTLHDIDSHLQGCVRLQSMLLQLCHKELLGCLAQLRSLLLSSPVAIGEDVSCPAGHLRSLCGQIYRS